MSKNNDSALYDAFSSILDSLSLRDNSPFVVAVSGGSDSMALLYLVDLWAREQETDFHVITIDHGLRAESAKEVLWVKDKCEEIDRPCHCIKLDLDGDKSSLQERAREARYQALIDQCHEIGSTTLLVAHHADDQIETLLHRLISGSGLQGLTGMDMVSKRQGVDIFRPLLSFKKSELLDFLKLNNKEWMEDPSNKKEIFTRVRLRQFLQEEGLSAKRLDILHQRLSRANDALDFVTQNLFEQFSSFQFWGEVTFDLEKFHAQPLEIQIRILEKMIRAVRGSGLSYMKLSSLEDIVHSQEQRRTLHGCLIDVKEGQMTVVREPMKQSIEPIVSTSYIWDDRFEISGASGYYVRPYKSDDASIIKGYKTHYLDRIDADYRLSIPVICDEHGEIVASLLFEKEHNNPEITCLCSQQKLAL